MPETELTTLEIKNIGGRSHIDFDRKRELWDFLMASYRGGLGISNRYDTLTRPGTDKQTERSGYYPGLFQFRREEDDDYRLRVQMTPYRPYARRIVKTFAKYVTKDEPDREGIDAYTEIIEDADLKGTNLTLFTRNILAMYLVLGDMNVLVDLPRADKQPVTRAEASAMGLRPYAVPILPQQVVDYELDNYGNYEWCIIESKHIINSLEDDKAKEVTRRTFWNPDIWRVYEQGQTNKWTIIDEGEHQCGRIPVIRVADEDIDNDVTTPEAWFYDLADINRAIYNLDSLDLSNFYYQTLGVMVIPGQMGNSQTASEMSNKTALFEHGQEENGITRFIAPDGTPYEAFDRKIENLKLEMFRIAGLSQRKDSRDAESAESKAWDFQDTNQYLAAIAYTADKIETEILSLSAAHTGTVFDGSVSYAKDFNVDDVQQIVATALDLKQIGFTSEIGRKEVLKKVYRELLPDLSPDVKTAIDGEIDASEERDPLLALANINDEAENNAE